MSGVCVCVERQVTYKNGGVQTGMQCSSVGGAAAAAAAKCLLPLAPSWDSAGWWLVRVEDSATLRLSVNHRAPLTLQIIKLISLTAD